MGFYGTLTGLVFLLAPMAGGAIGDYIGWRSTFYISAPFSIIAFLILFKMPEQYLNQSDAPLDWIGTLLLAAITIGIVMVFSWGGQVYDWMSVQVIGMAALFVLSLLAFVMYINKAKYPIFSPALFKNREFILVALGVGLIAPAMYAVGSYLPMVNQALAGTTSVVSGIIIAAKSAIQLVLGYAMGAYIAKTHRVKLVAVTTAAAYVVSNLLIGFSSDPSCFVMLMIGVLLSGYGTTGYSMVYTLHAQNELPKNLVGEASSTIQYIQSLCGTIGLSIVGMVLNISFASGLTSAVPEGLTAYLSADAIKGYMGTSVLTDSSMVQSAVSAMDQTGKGLFNQFVQNIHGAYADAMGHAFIVLALFSAAALIFALMLHASKKTNH